MNNMGKNRIIIDKVEPEINEGLFPIKKVVGENVTVRANIFTDGHEAIISFLKYRKEGDREWQEVRMKYLGNDRWVGAFEIKEQTGYQYTVYGALARFRSWRDDLKKKIDAAQDVTVDLKIGLKIADKVLLRIKDAKTKKTLDNMLDILRDSKKPEKAKEAALSENLLEIMEDNISDSDKTGYHRELNVSVERGRALFSSWYEFFPRSWSDKPGKHGTFKEAEKVLPEIARMGFNVIYLPPIHPIGTTNRKGKNNSRICKKDDPGCPWAIGAKQGGHKSINPELGTLSDFKAFLKKAAEFKLEVALDLAYQCSPDHPYVKEHPEWFNWRPDGTVQFAENPPKKYEDVLPINFETENTTELWEELKSIVDFWIDHGIKIFRVDNPHTKPFIFWDWLIAEVKKDHPDVLFLAEAFTRPSVMYRLAKGGFSQSYTYFTWRNTKKEFMDYMTELTRTEVADIMRPNFWPNTPDILPEHLQYGGRPVFVIRAVLAATLSSNYGIYGPAFELCIDKGIPEKEEYIDSEKYEIKKWDWDAEGNLKDFIARINKIRNENKALQMTRNIRFCDINNDQILCYYKATGDFSNIILVVINLDPYHTQAGSLLLPIDEIGIERGRPYMAYDLLSGDRYVWEGERNYIELNPHVNPAHIIKLRRHLKNEFEFDYFM